MSRWWQVADKLYSSSLEGSKRCLLRPNKKEMHLWYRRQGLWEEKKRVSISVCALKPWVQKSTKVTAMNNHIRFQYMKFCEEMITNFNSNANKSFRSDNYYNFCAFLTFLSFQLQTLNILVYWSLGKLQLMHGFTIIQHKNNGTRVFSISHCFKRHPDCMLKHNILWPSVCGLTLRIIKVADRNWFPVLQSCPRSW